MSSERQVVTVRDLVDEAKKRSVLLVICAVGLSYLMSLTSSSVIVNLPVATFLLITLRYLSLDLDMRRKAATYKSKPTSANNSTWRKPFEDLTVTGRDNWKHKVNSPVVEEAIGQFTGHIVSEWVTDLWYCRITPDRQCPEELLLIMNGALGEISSRMRNINLIDLLTRDIVNLLCSRLELFRSCKNKIDKQQSRSLTIAERDVELKVVLAAENNLHPALFSAEAEHKVLQHVMDGLILYTFKPEDLRCSLFRNFFRELLACAVMRPVLNLANPMFINERIESLITSSSKSDKGSKESTAASGSKIDGSSKIPNHLSGFPDPSVKGVELVPLKKDQNRKDPDYPSSNNVSGLSKDPLPSMDAQSTLSGNSMPEIQKNEGKGIQQHRSGGEWGNMLDVFARRKNEALTPEHLDNLWTKGRGYRKEEIKQPAAQVQRKSLVGVSNSVDQPQGLSEQKNVSNSGYSRCPRPSTTSLNEEENEHGSVPSDGVESWSSSYTDEEDTNNVTGLDSPAVKVWDGKNKRNFSHIHHPLETFEGHKNGKAKKACLHSKKLHGTKSAKKRFRSSIHDEIEWQEAARTSSLLREMQGKENLSYLSEDSDAEQTERICSGATTSSSMSLASLPEIFYNYAFGRDSTSFLEHNSIDNNRKRFRHFEELHRRLKDFQEYNLLLPPKHFLSTGLDVFIIEERCRLLDQYLKVVIGKQCSGYGLKLLPTFLQKLLQLPTVSCSIEVWDFLSVDSQMYIFSNSLSIIESISVDRNAPVSEKRKENWDTAGPLNDVFSSEKENFSIGSQVKIKVQALPSPKKPEPSNNSESVDQNKISSARNLGIIINRDRQASHAIETSELALSSEWIPPDLSVPILDLVDVVLQLNDGGWIRRKAFWAAKQVLQLGMGDAFDDWLIEKIQLLRQGSVVASGIRRLEQILWPDGIFITKHPARQNPSPASPSHGSHGHQPSGAHSSHKIEDSQNLEEMQQREAEQRAKLVYEAMIDKAPAAIVGLVGRKQYDLCAKDVYDFIQSSVCMKQLAYDLLQLLLLSAFPELGNVFKQLEEEKDKFGKLELN
ncbi:hypothetical protein F511_06120 [Dorcoceras hygrometricum]|uniref:Sorting nexin-13 n=1 Tax=Dorcoceras hygrometricum TaxID=472368 RepID=A0A2Z7DAJ0_9LAMI|nr:hypothetical protein F511_06120 [Dorcoceras hygrometricum]